MKNSHKKKRLIFVGATAAISLLALFFVISNFRQNIVFFYSPSELFAVKNSLKSRPIRIGGLVKEGSVKKIDALKTEFIVTDLEQELKVEYVGIVPDLFRDRQGVVAKGFYDEQLNNFFSREMLIKHDENYMPPEVAKTLRNKHEEGLQPAN
jgi:cytochrome c-type biogenesis protein CcmE